MNRRSLPSGRFGSRAALWAVLLLCWSAGPLTAATARATGFTQAEADPPLATASIAGSVAWSGCAQPQCSWVPFVSLQPDLPTYACRGDEIVDDDPATTVIFHGGRQNADGRVTFDVRGMALSGRRRVCASVSEMWVLPDPDCVAQAPLSGIDPSRCQQIVRPAFHTLREAILQPPAPPAAIPTPAPAPIAPPALVKRRSSRCGTLYGPVVLYAIRAHGIACARARRLGRSWRSHLRTRRCRGLRWCRARGYACRRARRPAGGPVRCRRDGVLVTWRLLAR